MAVRLNPRHQDMVRDKIKASQLINRLQDYVLGKPGVVLEQSQVSAALGLLKKCVADLSNVELTGLDGAPIQSVVEVKFVGNDP